MPLHSHPHAFPPPFLALSAPQLQLPSKDHAHAGRLGAWRKRQVAKSVNRDFWAPAAGSPTGASFRRREGSGPLCGAVGGP
jgi:hypothetical protein